MRVRPQSQTSTHKSSVESRVESESHLIVKNSGLISDWKLVENDNHWQNWRGSHLKWYSPKYVILNQMSERLRRFVRNSESIRNSIKTNALDNNELNRRVGRRVLSQRTTSRSPALRIHEIRCERCLSGSVWRAFVAIIAIACTLRLYASDCLFMTDWPSMPSITELLHFIGLLTANRFHKHFTTLSKHW